MFCFSLSISTIQLKEIICKNLDTAALPLYGQFWMHQLRPWPSCLHTEGPDPPEEGGSCRVHGFCHPPFFQNCFARGPCPYRGCILSAGCVWAGKVLPTASWVRAAPRAASAWAAREAPAGGSAFSGAITQEKIKKHRTNTTPLSPYEMQRQKC